MHIGLTGGIGSGKSTVAALLVAHGAVLIDADAISRQITAPGGIAMAPIVARFGVEMRTAEGALDRNRMRALAFGNEQARLQLEAILHPLIATECERQAAGAEADRTVVFDVPLLVESERWRRRVDRVLVIDARPETQMQRILARPGWNALDAQRVIAQQAPRAARRGCADAVIYNDNVTLAALELHVHALWLRWCTGVAR